MQPDHLMQDQLSTTGDLAVAQNKVLRNTYGLLALSMGPTVLGAVLCWA